jgi:hypothetical protein
VSVALPDARSKERLYQIPKLIGLANVLITVERCTVYLGANSAKPKDLSLCNKDGYAWGRSFFEGVENDLGK